ncbi:unnamed protein product [Pedinophyceae sp. YPF-701]|nr:unnamed protein product [Pedinophyceae sp. YPF-701]
MASPQHTACVARTPRPVRAASVVCRASARSDPDRCAQRPLAARVAACLAAGLLSVSPLGVAPASAASPIYDAAGVLKAERTQRLEEKIQGIEEQSGYKVRVFAKDGGVTGQEDVDRARRDWNPDSKTIIITVDPTAPNVLDFRQGDEVRDKIAFPFFTELQGRFGNIFYIRDNGVAAAVDDTVEALRLCTISSERCIHVPGVDENQYGFTLAFAVIAGIIAGASARIEPQGFVKRKGAFALVFAPLWGPFLVSYGLGPILSRTEDRTLVIANIAAFFAVAAIVALQDRIGRGLGMSPPPPSDQ